MTTDTLRQVFGTLRTPNGSPFPNKSLKWFRERRKAVAQGSSVVLDDPFIVTTDAVGEIDTDVMAGAYLVLATLSDADRYFRVVVPDQAGPFDISSLIDGPMVEPDDLTQFEALVAKAKAWANAPEDSVVESGEFSAKHYAAKAEDERLGAQTAVDNAVAAALAKAEEWAENPENVEVEGGKYSAKHWSAKSEEQRVASEAGRTGSELAATNAAAARDAAFVNANVFPDIATGRAAVADGQQFQVVTGTKIIRYRRDSSSTQTEVARYPSADPVLALLSKNNAFAEFVFPDEGLRFAITDENGAVLYIEENSPLGQIKGDPIFLDDGYIWAVTDFFGNLLGGERADFGPGPEPEVLPFVDADLRASIGFSGNFLVAKAGGAILSPSVNGARLRWTDKIDTIYHRREMATDAMPDGFTLLLASLMYGQSLVAGSFGQPVSRAAVRSGRALMLNGGTYPFKSPVTVDARLTDDRMLTLVDMREIGAGEVPVTGVGYWLTGASGIEAATAVFGVSCGKGGATIANLANGTQPFINLILAAERAHGFAKVRGVEVEFPSIIFDQGESNYSTAQLSYKAALLDLQSDLEADINAITEGADTIPLLCWQPSSWTATLFNRTEGLSTLAIMDAAITDPTKVKLIGPQYFFPYFESDGIHLTALGYRLAGEYAGRAQKLDRDGDPSGAVYATAASASGTTLTVTFNRGGLSLDTALVTDPGQNGLRVFDPVAVTTATLTGISIIGDTLTATLSTTLSGANWVLGIADMGTAGQDGGPTTGPRSNIRDSSADIASTGDPMYNWACHQRIAINV